MCKQHYDSECGQYMRAMLRGKRGEVLRQKKWMMGVGETKYAKSCLVRSVCGGTLQNIRNTAIRNESVVRRRTMKPPHHARAADDVVRPRTWDT